MTNKKTRTITISLRNWKRLSQLKIKEGLRGLDEALSFMFNKIKGGKK